jgi:DNA-binding NtrC family response regulator
VRELENIIERGVILCRSNILSVKDLSIDSSPFTCFDGGEEDLFQLSFREAKDKMNHLFHRYYIRELLKRNNGNISHAASAAGIQRQYLHRLMKEEDIHAEPFKDKS